MYGAVDIISLVQDDGGTGGARLNQGIFYTELALGVDALSYGRELELKQFLSDVVRQRGCALHLSNLWNALYFGYDLKAKGFRVEAIDPKRIPVREARKRDISLPVGGFIRLHTETASGELLGEVVYKEGARPGLGDAFVDPVISGAPVAVLEALGDKEMAVVHERFVLDLDAFGPDGNTISPKQYNRLLGKGRWIDARGHLLIEAIYPPEQAELEDVDYYIEYLLANHREGLLAFCFREEPTEDDLREALLNSFNAVRELAAGATNLTSWREKYFFASDAYRERVNEGDAILGGGDLQTIYRGLTRVLAGSRCSYAAIGPRMIDLLEQHGLDAEEEALVRGCAYATAVVHANVYVSEQLAVEQRPGVLADGVHMRLDDDWQAGGIWRAEKVVDPERYSLKTVPPILPLGLGYAGTVQVAPGDDEPPEAAPKLGPSQTSFTSCLTNRDRARKGLRLPVQAAAVLAGDQVDVLLVHDTDRRRMPVKREGTRLYGIEWPWSCHPGIVLHGNIESGMSVVKVRTEAAVPPIRIEDAELRFETNVAVYRHEMRIAELSPDEKRGVLTLTELIHRAFRNRGRDHGDGTRALMLSELTAIVLGPAWRPGESRPIAEALARMRLGSDGADFLWHPRVTEITRLSDRSLLKAYVEASPDRRLTRIVRRHWVPMHLREIPDGWRASPDKLDTYTKERHQNGMHGVLPEELPTGYTWVEPHERGSEGDELTMSQLEAWFEQSLADVAGTAEATKSAETQ